MLYKVLCFELSIKQIMKNLRFLLFIYIVSLSIAIFGFLIDSDITTNSFAFQMFEVFILSLFLFGVLIVFSLLCYSLVISIKGLLNR